MRPGRGTSDDRLRRRTFLAATGVTAVGGCLGVLPGDEGSDDAIPPPLDPPPTGVYRPTHGADLRVVGTADAGDVRLGLFYSYPDRFWELTGRRTYRRDVDDADEVHLMATAWDPETGIVLPEVGLTVEVYRDAELVVQEAVYAMLSQRLGFHYGDNVALPGDGSYEVTVSVGGLQIRRTGRFDGRFRDPGSATFRFDYRRTDRDDLPTTRPDDAGDPGAMEPATLPGVPNAVAPATDELAGDRLGRATTDDARLVATLLAGDDAARFDADRYLAISPRTPYNRMLLPSMGIRVGIERDGERLADDILTRTVDPALHYHYGTAVPEFRTGDELVFETLSPPQVARHEGYETAFVEMPGARLRL